MIGLGYVRGVREQEVKALVAVREAGGRFRKLSDLASRAGAGCAVAGAARLVGRVRLARRGRPVPSWGGSRASPCGSSGWRRPGRKVPGGTQLALPLDLPAPPELGGLSAWEAMLADYGTTGLTTRRAPARAAARDGCPPTR